MAAPIWEYLNAITHTKDRRVANDIDFEKEYQPYLINHSLSYHEDTVLAANLMNERHTLSKYLQFLFLVHTVAPRKRFSKWIKNQVSDDVRAVAEYYGCSARQARDLVGMHTSEQIEIIRSRLDKGGVSSHKGRRNGKSTSP